jgi:hypothetical protein
MLTVATAPGGWAGADPEAYEVATRTGATSEGRRRRRERVAVTGDAGTGGELS